MVQSLGYGRFCPPRPTVIYGMLLALNVIDGLLTAIGMQVGLPEANPFMEYLIQVGGIEAMFLAKLAGVGVILFAAELARIKCRRVPSMLLSALCSVSVVVAAHNAVLIVPVVT